MLVRRLAEAPTEDLHGLTLRLLVDAGDLGARNLSATWIEVPSGVRESLRSHEGSEQLYVSIRGTGSISVAGDTEQLEQGDVVLVPPATDHEIANTGDETFGCVSIQSPPVEADELFHGELTSDVFGAEAYEDE